MAVAKSATVRTSAGPPAAQDRRSYTSGAGRQRHVQGDVGHDRRQLPLRLGRAAVLPRPVQQLPRRRPRTGRSPGSGRGGRSSSPPGRAGPRRCPGRSAGAATGPAPRPTEARARRALLSMASQAGGPIGSMNQASAGRGAGCRTRVQPRGNGPDLGPGHRPPVGQVGPLVHAPLHPDAASGAGSTTRPSRVAGAAAAVSRLSRPRAGTPRPGRPRPRPWAAAAP